MSLPRTHSFRLDGKRALVTGASRGIGLDCAVAIELAPHRIRVNTIGPTFVRTALADQTIAEPERAAWIGSKIKLGRLAEVEDITGAVVFLACDASAMITGTSILIDGGWTAG